MFTISYIPLLLLLFGVVGRMFAVASYGKVKFIEYENSVCDYFYVTHLKLFVSTIVLKLKICTFF